jgi:ABC-2 type transport system ATP-binding protein
MTGGNAIEVEGLRFDYPGVRALDDVSFTVARGSVTALVGPNGAGKTTLLRCIAALGRPMLGAIRVAGIDVLEEPRACHQRVGRLTQSPRNAAAKPGTASACLRLVPGA